MIEGGAEIPRRVLTSLIFGLFVAWNVHADVVTTGPVDAPLPQVQPVRSWIPVLPISATWQTQPVLDSLGSEASAHSPGLQHDAPIGEGALGSEPVAPDRRKLGSCDDDRIRDWLMNQAILREKPGTPVFQRAHPRSNDKAMTDAGPNVRLTNSLVRTGGQGSLVLCMYALMGLGLYGAPDSIKRASCCQVTEWCHGRFATAQAGTCLALFPAAFATGPGSDLSPPESTSPYRMGIVVSLWRESQFTSDVISPRGPPRCAC